MNPAIHEKIIGFQLLTLEQLNQQPSITYVLAHMYHDKKKHLGFVHERDSLQFCLQHLYREGGMTLQEVDTLIRGEIMFIQELCIALLLLRFCLFILARSGCIKNQSQNTEKKQNKTKKTQKQNHTYNNIHNIYNIRNIYKYIINIQTNQNMSNSNDTISSLLC